MTRKHDSLQALTSLSKHIWIYGIHLLDKYADRLHNPVRTGAAAKPMACVNHKKPNNHHHRLAAPDNPGSVPACKLWMTHGTGTK